MQVESRLNIDQYMKIRKVAEFHNTMDPRTQQPATVDIERSVPLTYLVTKESVQLQRTCRRGALQLCFNPD